MAHQPQQSQPPAFDVEEELPSLPASPNRHSINHSKDTSDKVDGDAEIVKYVDEGPPFDSPSEGGSATTAKPRTTRGHPVVSTGADVSKLLVQLRDGGEPSLTFRSFFLGTAMACFGATLYQIYMFKPVSARISSVFLLLFIYAAGQAWAKFLPRRSWLRDTRYENSAWLGKSLDFFNPGKFNIKEHTVATFIATTASQGNTAVATFAVQRLYYNTKVGAFNSILAIFSASLFGYGIAGILRPLAVYPSEMVYWSKLPAVAILQTLHYSKTGNKKRTTVFSTGFIGMFFYEIIPAYIFPLLNGISVFCLSSQQAPTKTRDFMTNLFGGTNSNEGLGLLSISFDWQYIGSRYMSFPLVQQANTWAGYAICYIVVMVIYYSDIWNSKAFPMLSTSIFASNGSIYPQSYVFGKDFQLNRTRLHEVGLPALTGSNAWTNLVTNLSIGAMFTHCILIWGPRARKDWQQAKDSTTIDPHYQAMQKYKEAPGWWYGLLTVLAFFAGLAVVLQGKTTLPWWSYIFALFVGLFVTPFSMYMSGRLGDSVFTTPLMKMLAGIINPGRPVGNLYFSLWSHEIVNNSCSLAEDLKVGQYLKIPPRVMFLTQIWGNLVGALVNYGIMVTVVDANHEILIDQKGNSIWSGYLVQKYNSAAVTWSIAKDLYSPGGPYFIVPMGLLIGMGATTVQWLISKRWKKIGPLKVENIILPVIFASSGGLTYGVTSAYTSCIVVGLLSQLWLRRYHPRWYNEYNYVLGGALDGGSQFMLFILAFAVFGASGKSHPFPHWPGNPRNGNIDHCNGNGAVKRGF